MNRFRVSLKYNLDVLRYKLLLRLWNIWHCKLPRWRLFMRKEVTPAHTNPWGKFVKRFVRYSYWHANRPAWHMCCNGNDGGWRTQLCDAMEWRWRELEDRLFPRYEQGDDEGCVVNETHKFLFEEPV